MTEESSSPAASGLQDLGGVAASIDGKFLFVAGNSVADESQGEIAVFQIGAFGLMLAMTVRAPAEWTHGHSHVLPGTATSDRA